MKKLLLIALLFLITPYAKADMDYICPVVAPTKVGLGNDSHHYLVAKGVEETIKELKCERNNILKITTGIHWLENVEGLQSLAERFCRFDRNIIIVPDEQLSCVLYSDDARDLKELVN